MRGSPGVMTVDFDCCKYSMTSNDPIGEGLVKKRIRVTINSAKFVQRLIRAQCCGNHRHVTFTNFSACPCRRYFNELCDEVCVAVQEELIKKSRDAVPRVFMNLALDLQNIDHGFGFGFFDDVCGRPPGKDITIKVRKLEMDFFKKMNVYSKVVQFVAKQLGAKLTTT